MNPQQRMCDVVTVCVCACVRIKTCVSVCNCVRLCFKRLVRCVLTRTIRYRYYSHSAHTYHRVRRFTDNTARRRYTLQYYNIIYSDVKWQVLNCAQAHDHFGKQFNYKVYEVGTGRRPRASSSCGFNIILSHRDNLPSSQSRCSFVCRVCLVCTSCANDAEMTAK